MAIAVDKPSSPSASEQLIAKYGHAWEIWRELLPGGSHGDWIARRLPVTDDAPAAQPEELRAATIPALAQLLRSAE